METQDLQTGAAIEATAPTLPALRDRLALLTTERDKAYQIAANAQSAIETAQTASAITKASDDALRASNRHETLFRAVERIETQIAAAVKAEAEAEHARQWADYCDVAAALVKQAGTQKIIIEETVLKLAIEIEDKIENWLDELLEVEQAHAKTANEVDKLKKLVCAHSFSNPGQTYNVPPQTALDAGGRPFILGQTTESDYDREQRAFNEIFAERGLSLDALKAPKPTAQSGGAKFLLELLACRLNREPARATFSQALPEHLAIKTVNYRALAQAPNAASFLPPEIMEQYVSGAASMVPTGDATHETHPGLFASPSDTAEIYFARQQEAAAALEQREAEETAARRRETDAILSNVQPAIQPEPTPTQAMPNPTLNGVDVPW